MIEIIDKDYENVKNAWDNYQLPYLMQHYGIYEEPKKLKNTENYKVTSEINRSAFIKNNEYANILKLRIQMIGVFEESLIGLSEELQRISDKINLYIKKNYDN